MTTKELTNEELNIAICEWRGWRQTRITYWMNPNDYSDIRSELPSHILGIEALGNMHEAEKELRGSDEQFYNNLTYHERYHHYLAYLNETPYSSGGKTATSQQRAIALTRVVKPELFL